MFAIAQAGTALQVIKTDGSIVTLTLPAGVTIDPTINGVFAILNQQILFAGASTVNLWIDPADFTVRPLSLEPPMSAPVLAAGGGSGLTGNYSVAVLFAIKNAAGDVVNLSPLSPTSPVVALANQDKLVTFIPRSTDPNCNCRILFSTLSGGSDLFQWLTLDDNTTTTVEDAMPDRLLANVAGTPPLGVPPGALPGTALTLLTVWKSRAWGVSGAVGERDDVLFTEINQFYAWPAENSLPVYPKGEDAFGLTGLAARRDTLGLLKRTRVLKVIGSSPADFEVVIVAENAGCIAPKSVVIIRDVAYWLGVDGVYQWDDSGVVCVSRATVDPWFTTNTYFNRARFPNAFAGWNPLTNCYELTLSAVSTSVENRTVSYNLDKQEFLGPDLTSAFTPTARALLLDADDRLLPTMGASDGYLYLENQSAFKDTSGAAVDYAISGLVGPKWHASNAPDVTHFWGQLSVMTRIEASGTLTVTPYVGRLDAAAAAAISVDLTKGRQRLRRLGVGPLLHLEFTINTTGKGFLLYGYEVKPVIELGVR